MAFVYKITSPSGRIYIGSSNLKKIETRWIHYKKMTCYNQVRLLNSLKKYGYDNHILEVIWEGDASEMYKMESFYGVQFNVLDQKTGLNCCLPKIGDIPYTISEETRLKQSLSHLGKVGNKSMRDKMRLIRSGVVMSQHTKDIISKSKKGTSSHKEKSVICTLTNQIFGSIKEAAPYCGRHKSNLAAMLRGDKTNTTTLIYNMRSS